MKRIFYFFVTFVFLSCQNNTQENQSISRHLPENAEVIFITSNIKEFLNQLRTNSILGNSKLKFKDSFAKNFNFFNQLDTIKGELAISFSEIKPDSYIYTINSNANWGKISLDSVKTKSLETVKTDGLQFKKYNLDGNIFYLHAENGQYTITNSQTNLIYLVKEKRFLNDKAFNKAYNASDKSSASVFVNHKYTNTIQKSLFPNFNILNLKEYASWTVVDVDFANNAFNFNGISLAEKGDLQQAFQGLDPYPVELGAIAPKHSKGFFAFTYSDFKKFHAGLRNFKKNSLNTAYPKFLDFTHEMGLLYYQKDKILVLNTYDAESIKANLFPLASKTSEYRGFEIYKTGDPSIFKNSLSPLLQYNKAEFFSMLDHFLIFAEKESVLEELISSYQNREVLSAQPYYQHMLSKLSSESTMLFVAVFPEFKSTLSSGIGKNEELDIENVNLKNVRAFALQIVQDKNFAHLHGITAYTNSSESPQNAAVSQSFSIDLEEELATPPFFFKNHRSGQLDIAVQDKNNMLYLISNKGTIYWKKQLSSRITGKIHQVDILKNGKFQLAFSTTNSFEIVDRNGNFVKPFPIQFNEELTQPVAVFDYDNNRNYRFVLIQKNRLYMLDSKGESIKGFEFEKSQTEIIKPPKHIRLGSKDYILVQESSGKLNILSRQGSIRVPTPKALKTSEMEWFGYKNEFVSTDTSGNLIKINQKGEVSYENLALAENHKIDADSNNLVYLNENELSINGKTINLDFGLYTEPKIYQSKNRMFVGITDIQTQKVYVFKKNADLVQGFPVYGNSIVDIANADVDKKMELVVAGAAGELIMYQF